MADDVNGRNIGAARQGLGDLVNAVAPRFQDHHLSVFADQVGLNVLNSSIHKDDFKPRSFRFGVASSLRDCILDHLRRSFLDRADRHIT